MVPENGDRIRFLWLHMANRAALERFKASANFLFALMRTEMPIGGTHGLDVSMTELLCHGQQRCAALNQLARISVPEAMKRY